MDNIWIYWSPKNHAFGVANCVRAEVKNFAHRTKYGSQTTAPPFEGVSFLSGGGPVV